MPAKPSYSHRLQDGITALGILPTEWVGRRQLEEALGVSKTVAWRLLRQCGAEEGPGHTLLCRRTELISRLEELRSNGSIHEREIRRRDKLEEFLAGIRPDVVANLTRVVRRDQAHTLLSTTFKKLPANVSLTPSSLHIDFFGTEDFLQAFGAVVYALHNDYEAIRDFIEQKSGAALPLER